MPETTLPVFLVDRLPPMDSVIFDGEDAHHAVTVRRIREGERILLSDGAGGLVRCLVDAVQGGRDPALGLRIEQRWVEPPPALRVTVVQALPKGDRGELAVELATEAGVDTIVPWRASRSIVRWEAGVRGEKALARWRNTARAAAKQARRAYVPSVLGPVTTRELTTLVKAADIALVLESGITERLTDLALPEAGELLLVVGPEGGITDEELTTLSDAGAHTVRLGPTVLRTSTAATVALGALGALTTRWN